MAGLDENTPIPTEITLHRGSRRLELAFDDGSRFDLPFEFLRVYSPSAEVRGHGPGQETLQQGKRDVDIVDIMTPGRLHAEIAIAALEAGKHVIVEKPLANSLAEAEAMAAAAAAAEARGQHAIVNFNYRRVPAIALAKERRQALISAAVTGKIDVRSAP